jgi:hypothetical protein
MVATMARCITGTHLAVECRLDLHYALWGMLEDIFSDASNSMTSVVSVSP